MTEFRRWPVSTGLGSRVALSMILALGVASCGGADTPETEGATEGAPATDWVGPAPTGDWTGAEVVAPATGEGHFTSLTKLTHGGTNAEAYFAPDGERLIFQSTWPGVSECDQMYTMALDGSDLQMVSTGEGRTTCGFFFPGREVILFASTHLVGAACPPPPDRSQGYVWGLFDYDIFTRDLVTGEVAQLTNSPGYDAEATLSPDGSTIVFTSTRSGDLELWAMDADGSNPRQLTNELGYEGGAFFSPDGSQLVYRAFRPENAEEVADYESLLAQNLVRGARLEVYIMNADGSNVRQVTSNRAATFAPYFHPDGQRIVFSSNLGDPTGRSFQVYMINVDGSGQEQITNDGFFNSFPMFSPDGSQLVFSSDRGAPGPGEINVFLAEWSDASASAP